MKKKKCTRFDLEVDSWRILLYLVTLLYWRLGLVIWRVCLGYYLLVDILEELGLCCASLLVDVLEDIATLGGFAILGGLCYAWLMSCYIWRICGGLFAMRVCYIWR